MKFLSVFRVTSLKILGRVGTHSDSTSGRFGGKFEGGTYPDFPIKSCTPVSNSRDVNIGRLISPPTPENQVCVTAVQ